MTGNSSNLNRRKFITDDDGKVTGVLADTGDGQLLVNCKACIIAIESD